MCIQAFKCDSRTQCQCRRIQYFNGEKTSTTVTTQFQDFYRPHPEPGARGLSCAGEAWRPAGGLIVMHIIRPIMGSSMRGSFSSELPPGRNIGYSEFWFGYKFQGWGMNGLLETVPHPILRVPPK